MFRYYLLLAVLLVSGRASATECPVDAMPIQITTGMKLNDKDTIITLRNGTEVRLYALSRNDDVIVLSAFENSDLHFSYFVKTVTRHLVDRLGKDNLCTDNPDSTKRTLLQYVNWRLPLGEEKPLDSGPSLDKKLSGSCRVVSPWIDIVIGRSPVPWVRGVVRWNQRQLLADQAIMAGARNVPLGVARPLTDREFYRFMFEYTDAEIDHVPTAEKLKPLEMRVPEDLLWLFRQTVQTIYWPLDYAAGKAMKKEAESYTALTMALIDRCLASDGADLHYSSILDVAELISLQQYKISTPIR